MTEPRCSTAAAPGIAEPVSSRRGAVPKNLPERSRAVSLKEHETWLARWREVPPSSNHVVNASVSRCCSLTSNASSEWNACDCAGQVELGRSSCSQPPPRTSESLPSSFRKQPTSPQRPSAQTSPPHCAKNPLDETTR